MPAKRRNTKTTLEERRREVTATKKITEEKKARHSISNLKKIRKRARDIVANRGNNQIKRTARKRKS